MSFCIYDLADVFSLVGQFRKWLERLGEFLCRRKVAALVADRAAAERRAEELERENGELKRELAAKDDRLSGLERRFDFRRRFRRVKVGLAFVYVERDAEETPPCIVCPVCYERDEASPIFPCIRTDAVDINVCKKRVHLHCRRAGCGFHIAVSPETFRKAYEFVD